MNFSAKRINLIGILLLLGFTTVAARMYFDVPGRVQKSKPVATATEAYICPMHHDVVSAKPGNCPKCGMALVAASQTQSAEAGCGSETDGGCCAAGQMLEKMLPPGHPPVPGFKIQSTCDEVSGAVTNSPK